MSHTKEPWSYQASIPEEGYECFWIISRCRQISSFDGPQNDEQFSNVRRIVACVNACAGIPIDMLEAMPSGPASLLPMYARLEKQRDELLAALENCRLLAARHRKEDWALLILGFCAEGGVVGSITR
jgi:hypothetical protein